MQVTWNKWASHRALPHLINPPRLSSFVKRRPGKMWAIAQLIRPSADFENCHCFFKTMIVRAVHRGEVSSHEVRLSELHGTPQRHKSTSLLRNNGRSVLRMPVTHWTNCAFPTCSIYGSCLRYAFRWLCDKAVLVCFNVLCMRLDIGNG